MNRTVAFHEVAVVELNEAVDFYNLECPGLGLTFLQEVQTALATIAQFPESTPLLQGRVRRKVLLRFPYTVIYSIRGEQIRVLALAHEKRRPFYWRGRG
jgi:toxin ParE1/3/4